MEKHAWELLNQLAARVPSVRVPVAALSGGQRQAVAIARSLLGEPRVIVLDEPTAALGLRQTAEFLTLVERLRERGHGVVLTSHSLADVQAVADRIVVLRLGRTNGEFDAAKTSYEELLAAVTGIRSDERPERAPRTPWDLRPTLAAPAHGRRSASCPSRVVLVLIGSCSRRSTRTSCPRTTWSTSRSSPPRPG